jgi:hypothetical protein
MAPQRKSALKQRVHIFQMQSWPCCIPDWPLFCVIIPDIETGDKKVLLKG